MLVCHKRSFAPILQALSPNVETVDGRDRSLEVGGEPGGDAVPQSTHHKRWRKLIISKVIRVRQNFEPSIHLALAAVAIPVMELICNQNWAALQYSGCRDVKTKFFAVL
jgi:hypothetical protein